MEKQQKSRREIEPSKMKNYFWKKWWFWIPIVIAIDIATLYASKSDAIALSDAYWIMGVCTVVVCVWANWPE